MVTWHFFMFVLELQGMSNTWPQNQSTQGKTSDSRVENEQSQPTYSIKVRFKPDPLVEGTCSHHWANTALTTGPTLLSPPPQHYSLHGAHTASP